jgi:membrane protease YdiL (CAAX protease family)
MSTSPQLALETPGLIETPKIRDSHRWTDLGLVMIVAFAGSILRSTYLAFHPVPPEYSNIRLVGGIITELTALALFIVLFKRQGRRFQNIGFKFRWTDLPKGLGLAVAVIVVMWVASVAINRVWFLILLRTPHSVDTRNMFSECSIWLLLPFLVLNPFFEETLVRGYLTTELIDLQKSWLLAALVSVLVQTSYHLYYGLYGALVVGCGLSVFAFYYARSRRLMPVIIAHMLWDLTALLHTWHR